MRLVFEQETCTRCGGCGQHSYCQQWGTVCFKCAGSGRQLTRRGRAASAAYQTWLEETFSRPVEAIKDGDRVLVDGRYRQVSHTHQSGSSSRLDPTTHEWISTPTFCFDYVLRGVVHTHGAPAGHTFVVWTPDLGAAMRAWATDRKGVTIEEQ